MECSERVPFKTKKGVDLLDGENVLVHNFYTMTKMTRQRWIRYRRSGCGLKGYNAQ